MTNTGVREIMNKLYDASKEIEHQINKNLEYHGKDEFVFWEIEYENLSKVMHNISKKYHLPY